MKRKDASVKYLSRTRFSPHPAKLTAVVSVHDVMPETLPDALETLSVLKSFGVPPPVLLVVPGKPWSESNMHELRELRSAGYPLAGHGWSHRATDHRSLFHRLHGRMVSQDAAEHLSRDANTIRCIVARCHQWFINARLRAPALYVPPAWAMGRLSRRDLRRLPFARYEYLGGVYDARADRWRRLPLAGFEAHPRERAGPLRAWNAANVAWARLSRRPLRVAIHPADLRLPLAEDLGQLLRSCARFIDDAQAMQTTCL